MPFFLSGQPPADRAAVLVDRAVFCLRAGRSNGSPATTTTSARLPGVSEPVWAARPSSRAAELVVATSTSDGVMPPAAIRESPSRLLPCGPTPPDVQTLMTLAPARTRAASRRCAPRSGSARVTAIRIRGPSMSPSPTARWIPMSAPPASRTVVMPQSRVAASAVPPWFPSQRKQPSPDTPGDGCCRVGRLTRLGRTYRVTGRCGPPRPPNCSRSPAGWPGCSARCPALP